MPTTNSQLLHSGVERNSPQQCVDMHRMDTNKSQPRSLHLWLSGV